MPTQARAQALEAVSQPGAVDYTPDEQLLRRFLAGSGDQAESAFAALIERHGPMVHRVCFDVLRDREDARDAAQAVFLVLARRARSIRKPGSLGSWLHGVALRVARRARVDRTRARVVEQRRAEIMREREPYAAEADFLGLEEIHAEVDRLPEKYKAPIVLCYLRGQTQAEAAEALGWPLGTVQIRLHRGRDRLRSRLVRRGFGGASLLVGPALAEAGDAATSLEAGWARETARAAVECARGSTGAATVTPRVAQLADRTAASIVRRQLGTVALTGISLLAPFLLVASRPASRPAVTASHPTAEPAVPPAQQIQTHAQAPARPADEKPRLAAVDPPGSDQPAIPQRPNAPIPERNDRKRAAAPTSSGGPRLAPGPVSGRELFERVWSEGDPRSHGGDGLGPVFNGSSCLGCHYLAGAGGAGGLDQNVQIATLIDGLFGYGQYSYAFSMDLERGRFEYQFGVPSGTPRNAQARIDPAVAAAIHPGFREGRSIVLHLYSTDPQYAAWRKFFPGLHGSSLVRLSERNTPPLFGVGVIDAIPDAAIEAGARRKSGNLAVYRGRVSRLKDGRIGRFGWKAQTATLKDFVLSAAAGEIGLEVPGQRQGADPRTPGVAAPGLDLNQEECDALTGFVRKLPAPVAHHPVDAREASLAKSGEEVFRTAGCAHCHTPTLGDAKGIYSDLLLHDMGPKLADAESYSVFVGGGARAGDAARPKDRSPGASSQEWRTPPLWGLRDSGPFLHDGRAATIEQAIQLHGGQGSTSARRYSDLSPARKRQLVAFLNTLAAPEGNR